ncbi:MAG: dTDP-4-dehydrorhamnose reductase [Gemmatimonadetes bacterium]|nr:MAG: dTDP-4-dehydrorhamnose reductase [Gemmatimonadota bacterium]
MRVMVLGAGGMLGHDLVATAPPEVTLFAFSRTQLDITHSDAVAATLGDVRPDVVINAAAYTAVDRAESEVAASLRVNGAAVGALGRMARAAGARVIHFSTDYVFDGQATRPYREDSPTDPVNAYGTSKLAGETALRASGPEHLVVRTQWLFGVHGKSFPRTMWERARAGLATRVVRDQTGRPTYAPDLAAAVWTLIRQGACGVLHVANQGEATWFDVAAHIFGRVGKPDLLTPCVTADYPTPARRPRYSVLDTTRAEQVLGGPLAAWEDAMDRFLSSPI